MHHYQWLTDNRHQCTELIKIVTQPSLPPHWTAQVQSLGVGIGALFAGFGGLKIGLDWLDQIKLKRKLSRFLRRYPINDLDKTYRLVDIRENSGKWWLLDETAIPKARHWIRNYDTVRDMGWHGEAGLPRRITKAELEKYERQDPINTRDL